MVTPKSTAMMKKAMLEALSRNYCIVSRAADAAGIERGTHYVWYHNDEEYKQAVDELDNTALDHTEGKLHDLIEGVYVQAADGTEYKTAPNVTAVIFHLKTRGRKRGYIEKETIIEETETIQPPSVTFTVKDMSKPKDGTEPETI